MAINKRGVETFVAKDEELTRFQRMVETAIRRLQEDVDASIAAIPVSPTPVPVVLPTVASLEVDFGTFGRFSADSRVWGIVGKPDAISSTIEAFGMIIPGILGGAGAAPPTVGNPRGWTFYETGLLLSDAAGHRGSADNRWVQNPRLITLVQVNGAVVNRRVWIVLASGNMDQFSTDATKKYVGLRFDTAVSPNWFVCTSDGVTASETNTGIVVAADTDYHIDLNLTNPASLSVKINGVETVKTTNLPSGATNFSQQIVITSLLAGVQYRLYWHHTMLSRK